MSKRLGEYLQENGKLEEQQLARALSLQDSSDERLGRLLIQLGFVAERDVARALANQLGLPLAEPDSFPLEKVLGEDVSYKFLLDSQVLPLSMNAEALAVAMATPQDEYVLEALKMAVNREIEVFVAAASDIEAALNRIYRQPQADSTPAEAVTAATRKDDIAQLRDLASEAPVIRQVNNLISRALELAASDIHIEPFPGKLRVRMRIDGVLREMDAPAAEMASAVISRIKIMANLDIAERRLPQDGRINLQIEGKLIDMRISTLPAAHGESVVMRLLDKEAMPLDFTALGFTTALEQAFKQVLELPYGIELVTGPTGSGKTTTLYAALEYLNSSESKILTVEDPVEYQLEGINQIQVKPAIGLTFAKVLRSILRQDPDIIMIGEMRDLETAKIAVQAALTGHKVFSTLHTNNASSSITRLLDMGVEDYLVTSTLNAILAQRLVRKLCTHCRQPYTAIPELATELELSGNEIESLYRPSGCSNCDHTGYRGRTMILELMVMNDALRKAILNREDASNLQQLAKQNGMQSMYHDAVHKAVAGITSLEEIFRVTQAHV